MRRSSLIVGVGARFLILPRATRTCGAGEMISTRPGLAGTERRGGPRAEPLRLVPGLVCVSARWRITARSNANRDPERVHRTRVGTNQAVVLISPFEKPGRKRPGLKGARCRAPRLPGSSLVREGKAELDFSNRGSAPWSLAIRASAVSCRRSPVGARPSASRGGPVRQEGPPHPRPGAPNGER